jgi:hypothetical protein
VKMVTNFILQIVVSLSVSYTHNKAIFFLKHIGITAGRKYFDLR